MQIVSTAFTNNSKIPEEYTCVGKNINPPLGFIDVPTDAKSLALIMDDPDAPNGTFTHWVIYNIPPDVQMVEEASIPPGMVAKNSAGENQYMGPCPPSGEHRYYFKLYALGTILSVTDINSKEQLQEAMKGHIIEDSELMGLFSKS
jgi:Raf kinase inhibitor-like YbhB/YbcL family protein